MTHTFAATPARSRTLPRASRAPHSKNPLTSNFSEKIQITAACRLINRDVPQESSGFYSTIMRVILSSASCHEAVVIESGEQSVEHLLAPELSFLAGVVALCLQGRAEFDGGLEESAGFADGFEVTVQADGRAQ